MESELECYPCPYTGNTCYKWNCADCEIEQEFIKELKKQFSDDERMEDDGR